MFVMNKNSFIFKFTFAKIFPLAAATTLFVACSNSEPLSSVESENRDSLGMAFDRASDVNSQVCGTSINGQKDSKPGFLVEERKDSLFVSVKGLASACNRSLLDVNVRIEGDTLYAEPVYDEHVTVDCVCNTAEVSFVIGKKYEGAKVVIVGDEAFPIAE